MKQERSVLGRTALTCMRPSAFQVLCPWRTSVMRLGATNCTVQAM